MSCNKRYKSGTAIRNTILAVPFIFSPMIASAQSFTAGIVMEKMDAKERYTFVAGIVEGLAMARYVKDGKKPEGMKCIYAWFYENPEVMRTVSAAFERYPSYPPGTVVDVLTKTKCGE